MVAPVTIIHISDLHFGGYADLKQIEALEEFLPSLAATALVVSGDLSQRARHGEFQAAHVFMHRLRMKIPALIVPGNHDIEWWKSPLGLLGERRKYAKYLKYYQELRPVLEVPGALLA
ncbi:MAG TPA: metallophosphoesterase, partial [Gemmatimonadales bacterium]